MIKNFCSKIRITLKSFSSSETHYRLMWDSPQNSGFVCVERRWDSSTDGCLGKLVLVFQGNTETLNPNKHPDCKTENVAEKGTLAAILGKEQVRKIHKLPLSPLNPLDGPFILVPQIQRDEKTTGMGINYEKNLMVQKALLLGKAGGQLGGQTWRELLKEVPGNTEKVSEKWLLTITLSVRTGQNSFRTNWREMPFPTAYSFSVNPSLQYLMNVK